MPSGWLAVASTSNGRVRARGAALAAGLRAGRAGVATPAAPALLAGLMVRAALAAFVVLLALVVLGDFAGRLEVMGCSGRARGGRGARRRLRGAVRRRRCGWAWNRLGAQPGAAPRAGGGLGRQDSAGGGAGLEQAQADVGRPRKRPGPLLRAGRVDQISRARRSARPV